MSEKLRFMVNTSKTGTRGWYVLTKTGQYYYLLTDGTVEGTGTPISIGSMHDGFFFKTKKEAQEAIKQYESGHRVFKTKTAVVKALLNGLVLIPSNGIGECYYDASAKNSPFIYLSSCGDKETMSAVWDRLPMKEKVEQAKEMTVEQVEKALGHKVKIIKG